MKVKYRAISITIARRSTNTNDADTEIDMVQNDDVTKRRCRVTWAEITTVHHQLIRE